MKQFIWALALISTVTLSPLPAPADDSGQDRHPAPASPVMGAIFLPTGSMTLAVPLHIPAKRSAVVFSHSGHFTLTCTTCHHTWDRSSPMNGCSASGCHDRPKPKSGQNAEKQGRPYYQDAFHASCRDCHRRITDRNKALEQQGNERLKPAGPTGCTGCHPRA